MELKNKVVWVVGASSGIGKEMLIALYHQGAKLVLSARREEEIQNICDEISMPKENYLILPLDLSNINDVKVLTEKIIAKFNKIDILINNAGVNQRSEALETDPDVERNIMEINFFGHVKLAKAVSKIMQEQKSGKIVIIDSIVGKFGLPWLSSYSASKHALKGYFESLRYEVEKHGIKVLIVYPGFIATDIDKKSLTENGQELNEKSEAQKNGMPASVCAKKIINAIKSNKITYTVGGKEILMPMVNFFAPRLFYKLMAKLHKL